MDQATLDKELGEYNSIVHELQRLTNELQTLEQNRLIKLGRLQVIQNLVEEAKASTTDEVPPK